MEPYIVGRVLHVLGVVLWIGGVAMVTTVLLPVSRFMKWPEGRVAFFERIESRFAWQARFTTLLTGITGFWMLYLIDGWSRYQSPGFWWIHAMTAVWIIFTLVLFVLEPLVLHRLFLKRAEQAPEKTFVVIQVMHWVLLTISLVTVAGAVAGSHGWLFGQVEAIAWSGDRHSVGAPASLLRNEQSVVIEDISRQRHSGSALLKDALTISPRYVNFDLILPGRLSTRYRLS